MIRNRRDFFARLASMSAGLWAGGKALAQQDHNQHTGHGQQQNAQRRAARETGIARGKPAENIPVETPDVPKLPYKMVDGVKEFNLIPEVVRTEFVPGRVVDAWG